MKTIITYNRFFAYSENQNKCFHTEFNNGINIIYGKNTSGKSTLIQAINYTFGINDEKHKLNEILRTNVIFRLDFEIKKESTKKITIVRDSDFLYLKEESYPTLKFSGISANNSESHKRFKQKLSELFGFNCFLESKGEYKLASIETIFLPYYVSQDYGWVLTLSSFRGLSYYKNFKRDYYDYYLGINNKYNRLDKQQLEEKKRNYENEITFLEKTERKDDQLLLAKLKDETFAERSSKYIDEYKKNKDELIKKEKEYILISNKICFLEQRVNILNKVKRAINNQYPLKNKCPTCRQLLPSSTEILYEYFQDHDDTLQQIKNIKQEIKEKTGKINSLQKEINELRVKISKDYSILEKYEVEGLTVNKWIENKANIQLSKNIVTKIGQLKINIDDVNKKLEEFKTEDSLDSERKIKDDIFNRTFNDKLKMLSVNNFGESYSLYKMGLFPQQGVELLKTLLAYHFTFNNMIKETTYIHRLPFVLDAIFKEDVDEQNREDILKFINTNKPTDTQLIFSVAQSKDKNIKAVEYNRTCFNNEAKLILINLENDRSFLRDYNKEYDKLRDETLSITE